MAYTPPRARSVAALIILTTIFAGCTAARTQPPAPAPLPTAPPVLTVTTPVADPGRGVVIATGVQDEPVDVAVDGGADGISVTYRQITLSPGASTGRHCHHGQVIGVVDRGELAHHADFHPGGVRVYRAGDSIIEPAGLVHEARNDGPTDVVLTVNYVTTHGTPLIETDLTQCEP